MPLLRGKVCVSHQALPSVVFRDAFYHTLLLFSRGKPHPVSINGLCTYDTNSLFNKNYASRPVYDGGILTYLLFRAMLFANPMSPEEIQTLEEMHKNHPCHPPRIRAHAVLLSHSGLRLSQIASVYGVCRQTASTWLHAWEDEGICGLLDGPRSGAVHASCLVNKRVAIFE